MWETSLVKYDHDTALRALEAARRSEAALRSALNDANGRLECVRQVLARSDDEHWKEDLRDALYGD